jgi:pimeloyl-ACP methyl ester carboxylesterase
VISEALSTTSLGDHGSPIVFCHGLFGQGRNWTQIGKALATDHRVLLVDMPNHGASPWTEDFGYVAMAEQVAALLDADDPVTLVGHSMGGKTAMVLALRHPQLVERLCVVDISPVAQPASAEFAGYIAAMQQLDLTALERRSDADEALAPDVPNRTVRSFLLQNLRREDDGWRWLLNLDVLGAELATLGGWPQDELADATPFDGPVLWIGGANSPYVRDDYAEAMDRWFPRNRRVTVKDAGHWVHSEQPAVFVEVLRRFVEAGQA